MNQREHPTHELISAFLDDELSADERARVEQLICSSDEHQRVLEDLQSLGNDMQQLPDYKLDDQFVSRVLVAARVADPTLESRHENAAATKTKGMLTTTRHPWRLAFAVVASVAAVLLAAFFAGKLPTGPGVGPSPDDLIAQGGDTMGADQNNTSDTVQDGATDAVDTDTADTDTADTVAADTVAADTDTAGMGPVAKSPDFNNVPDSKVDRTAVIGSSNTVIPIDPPSVVTPADTDSNELPKPRRNQSIPAPKIEVGPGRITQKVLLVIDVQLTPAGAETRQFERVLRQAGVAFDTNIEVNKGLEESFLASRFFESSGDAEDAVAERTQPFSIVYVASRAGAIDRVWQQMKQDPSHFVQVTLDMALRPGDATVFRQLQQLGDAAAVEAPDPEGAPQSVAHRLELRPSWNGRPAEVSAGAGALGAMLSGTPGLPEGSQSNQRGAAPSMGLFGGDLSMEAIFVVRH